MKILWICNMALPIIAKNINIHIPVGGGWLTGLAESLTQSGDVELTVSFPDERKHSGKIDNISYNGFSLNSCFDDVCEIISLCNPDVVEIFGTEYKLSLDAIDACIKMNKINNTLVHIQGLVSVCSRHYYAGLPPEIYKRQTIRDFIKGTNIEKSSKAFAKRGKYEIEVIKKAKHICGRTDWDYACTTRINPEIKYYMCNETLRGEFYKNEWSLEGCDRHSIFVSQSGYPLKGFHHMLEAMIDIVKKYPDTICYTTGRDIINRKDIISINKCTYYERYLLKLVKKYGLESHVKFLTMLDEKHMCERFLKSHVFVLPSSIENSPNSLGEAMLLGVPTVASDVGGVKNMIKHEEEGFVYQHDAPYMLAHYVCKIFENDTLAEEFSVQSRQHAIRTHDRENNYKTIMGIYNRIKEV